MIELLEANWILALVALLLGILVAWYVFHASRRTRVGGARRDVLDEGAAPAERNRALIDAPPAVTRADPAPIPVTTPEALAGTGIAIAAAAEEAQIEASNAGPDDLSRIKGVGPKLVALLHELGVVRFEQIAKWDDAEIDRIDALLGRFQGRIRRDNWVEQSRFLAADDVSGFEGRFGNLR